MRNLLTTIIILTLVLTALPASAGDEKRKCDHDMATCAEEMAAKFRHRGWVGINLDYGEDGDRTWLSGVFEKSPAEAAGLRVGDVLLELNGIAYTHDNERELYAEYQKSKPGDQITYKIERNGKTKTVDVTLAKLPDRILAQWIGQHVMEAHLAANEEPAESNDVEQAQKGD